MLRIAAGIAEWVAIARPKTLRHFDKYQFGLVELGTLGLVTCFAYYAINLTRRRGNLPLVIVGVWLLLSLTDLLILLRTTRQDAWSVEAPFRLLLDSVVVLGACIVAWLLSKSSRDFQTKGPTAQPDVPRQ